MNKIVKLIIWLGLVGLLSFGIWTCSFSEKKKVSLPTKTKPPKKTIVKDTVSADTLLCQVVIWQVGKEYIDSIFADDPRYFSPGYRDNGIFDAELWAQRSGKLERLTFVRTKYSAEIEYASKITGLNDPKLLSSLVTIESGGDPNARNPRSSASGLCQLINSTAKKMGVKNVFDPQENLIGGAKYLKEQLNTFGGDINKAIFAYYYGPNDAKTKLDNGMLPTDERYVQSIKYLYAHS